MNDLPSTINQDIKGLIPDSTTISPEFLQYFLSASQPYLLSITEESGHGTKALRTDLLYASPVLMPSLFEQQAIAAFLDRETARIDGLIAKKKRLIELLREKRQAVISHAVTKGLDPSAPMKDSGIDWLGEIPAHWKASVKLSFIAEDVRNAIVNGPFGSDLLTSELVEAGVPVIYSGDVRDAPFTKRSQWYVTEEKAHQLRFCEVIRNDVLVAKVGDPPGTATVYPETDPPAIVTQDVVRIRPDRKKVLPNYLAALLNSSLGRVTVRQVTVESTRGRFSLGDFKSLRFPLPSVSEQQDILEEISKADGVMLKAISKVDDAIEKMTERRAALITAAVTGKIDVRAEIPAVIEAAE